MLATIKPGLEGVIASETRLSHVDGQKGELIIAGFPLEVIAPNAEFEEMIHLLWHDRLPNAAQLTELRTKLNQYRVLPDATFALLENAAARGVAPIDALRMAADSLSLAATSSYQNDALMLIGALPTIITSYWRLLNGQPCIAPRPDFTTAENYLYMLSGSVPTLQQVRGLSTYLNTVSDHGFNASTFTARVIISTNSDMISAVVGAIGALKGPAHGGAPGPALDTVFEIGTPEKAERVLWDKLSRGERLMGFGHRVYKVRDPRADVLNAEAARMFLGSEREPLYHLAKHVEDVALRILEEHKPGRHLQTNVEFFTALVLHGLEIPTELFTPTFALGRLAGWTAHCFEQVTVNRIIRPASVYTGDHNRDWTPLATR